MKFEDYRYAAQAPVAKDPNTQPSLCSKKELRNDSSEPRTLGGWSF
jgi:hypothetical protein